MLETTFNVTDTGIGYLLIKINNCKNLIFSVSGDRIEIYYVEYDNEDPFPIYEYKYDGGNTVRAVDIFFEEIKQRN